MQKRKLKLFTNKNKRKGRVSFRKTSYEMSSRTVERGKGIKLESLNSERRA